MSGFGCGDLSGFSPATFFAERGDSLVQSGDVEFSRNGVAAIWSEPKDGPITSEHSLYEGDRFAPGPKTKGAVVRALGELPLSGWFLIKPVFNPSVSAVAGSQVAICGNYQGSRVLKAADNQIRRFRGAVTPARERVFGCKRQENVCRISELRAFYSDLPVAFRCRNFGDGFGAPRFSIIASEAVKVVFDLWAGFCKGWGCSQESGDDQKMSHEKSTGCQLRCMISALVAAVKPSDMAPAGGGAPSISSADWGQARLQMAPNPSLLNSGVLVLFVLHLPNFLGGNLWNRPKERGKYRV